MTFVTSSRKPSPKVRKLAKEIAFALDLPYVQRGKTGLRMIETEDSIIILLSDAGHSNQRFDLIMSGKNVFSMLITNILMRERIGPFHRGLVIREHRLHDVLSPHFPTMFDADAPGSIVFSGTQRMQYILQVIV